MSTSIDGWLLIDDDDDDISICDLLARIKRFRKKFTPVATKIIHDLIAAEAVELLDTRKSKTPLSDAIGACYRGYMDTYAAGGSRYAFDLHAVFYQLKDGTTLATTHTVYHREYDELWKNNFGAIEYDYYDNSDKPARISSAIWNKRKRDWNQVLSPTYCAALEGLNISMLGQYGLPGVDVGLIAESVPSFESRLDRLAKDKVITKQAGDGSLKSSVRAITWLSSKDGQQSLRKMKTRLAPRMIPQEQLAKTLTSGM